MAKPNKVNQKQAEAFAKAGYDVKTSLGGTLEFMAEPTISTADYHPIVLLSIGEERRQYPIAPEAAIELGLLLLESAHNAIVRSKIARTIISAGSGDVRDVSAFIALMDTAMNLPDPPQTGGK